MAHELEFNIDELLKENVTNTYKSIDTQVKTRKKKPARLKLTKAITVTMTDDEFDFLEQYCGENHEHLDASFNNMYLKDFNDKYYDSFNALKENRLVLSVVFSPLIRLAKSNFKKNVNR